MSHATDAPSIEQVVQAAQGLAVHAGFLSEEVGRLRAVCRAHSIDPDEPAQVYRPPEMAPAGTSKE